MCETVHEITKSIYRNADANRRARACANTRLCPFIFTGQDQLEVRIQICMYTCENISAVNFVALLVDSTHAVH